jgi:23S rRNA (cytosine1962-C5)-methyltransferase
MACINDPAIGPEFLIDSMATEAPSLTFQERLENPPEFADAEVDGGLKTLIFC